jgi:hypothetical protein
VTAQQQLIQLADGSRAILEAAALLDQPFSVSLLIDLGFSADSLDPLFDSDILRETLPTRAEFMNSELRNELLGRMPWSKRRRFCEQVGVLLSQRCDSLDVVCPTSRRPRVNMDLIGISAKTGKTSSMGSEIRKEGLSVIFHGIEPSAFLTPPSNCAKVGRRSIQPT